NSTRLPSPDARCRPACGGSVVRSYTYGRKGSFGFLALTSPMLCESQFYEPCQNRGCEARCFNFILRPKSVGRRQWRHFDQLPPTARPGRRPQRTSTEAAMIERLTVKNPAVTRFSCQGCPLWPAAEIGDFAAVPKTAASVVVSQFA